MYVINLVYYRLPLEDMPYGDQSMRLVFQPGILICNTLLNSCFNIVISFLVSVLWKLYGPP